MKILVTGATSMIGDFLLAMLIKAGYEIVAISRSKQQSQAGTTWYSLDINEHDWFGQLPPADLWIHLADIGLLKKSLPQALEILQVKQLIVFSSTSRYTKCYARSVPDRALAQELIQGERFVEDVCTRLGVVWNIIRPTMIYYLGRDKNLSLISRFIQHFHFFPMIGSGQALRQPVHARDLAWACLALLNHTECANRAYNLSGGEVIGYRDMVTRLFVRLDMKPRFVHIPLPLFRVLIAVLRILPRYRYLTTDMADRMTMDMVFSHQEATKDFGYFPRPFQP